MAQKDCEFSGGNPVNRRARIRRACGVASGLLAAGLGLSACGAASQDGASIEERNRQMITAYYAEPDEVRRLAFMANEYRQHNPLIADGLAGLRAFFLANQGKYPSIRQRVVRIAADGDLVWVHLHTVRHPGDRGLAVINIFRIEAGKIAEHWDVVQPVPERSANSNTMF